MKLRYYTGLREFHISYLFYVLNLLNQINEKICPVEIITDRTEDDIWRNDLRNNRAISKNTGHPPAKWFTASSGNLHIYGTLAIVEKGTVQWVAKHYRLDKEKPTITIEEALDYILGNRKNGIEHLFEEIKTGKTEHTIRNDFIKSGILKGNFDTEVEVGMKRIRERATSDYRKEWGEFENKRDNILLPKLRKIDAVCKTSDLTWILEVKKELNFEAIGQVLTYKELYKEDNPEAEVKLGIICDKFNKIIGDTCKDYGIKVFWKRKDKWIKM